MGRPRKDQTKEEVVNNILNNVAPEEIVEPVDNIGNVEVELPVFDHLAVGLFRDPITGKATFVEIPYNASKQLGTPNFNTALDGMDEGREMFKRVAGIKIL